MAFEFGTAQLVDADVLGQLGGALRRTGRPVALVPLGADLHAGHLALVRAASQVRGAATLVALDGAAEPQRWHDKLAAAGCDAVFSIPDGDPMRRGRTRIFPEDRGLEPVSSRSEALTQIVALINAAQATDVFVGEKDYELLIDLQHAVTDLHLRCAIHGVPTVRTADGLALSLRNTQVATEHREQAIALSAALAAGAHVAEKGAEAVLTISGDVLAAAGVTPEYLELRSGLLAEPAEGDGRLLVAADFGGVRLIDNVGVPLGIGFRGLAAAGA